MVSSRADYKAIAAKSIRKAGNRELRLLVYGRNKIGKSRFCATAPNVLIIDPDINPEGAYGPTNPDTWPVSQWSQMNEALKFLQAGGHGYDWLAVDGLTRLSNMALRFVMRMAEERDLDRIPGQVEKRDYNKSGELIKGMLYNLHALPMGIIYTAQDRMEVAGAFSDSEDDDATEADARFVPDLPKGVRGAVNGIVDLIGRIYSVKVEGERNGKTIKGRQRRLWIAPSDQYDTGYRSMTGMPDFIKGPTITKVVELRNRKAA